MTEPTTPAKLGPFTAAVTPTLTPEAAWLVTLYDQTPGSSGPYCNPDGLAAVLEWLSDDIATALQHGLGINTIEVLRTRAVQLRGKP